MVAPSRRPEVRREKYAAKNTVTMSVDMSALDSLLEDLGDAVGESLRPAAQAAAQVLYDEVVKNVNSIGSVTGNLRRSIYQVYSKRNSEDGKKAVYHVSWNTLKAPHGHLIEYGHIQSFYVYMGSDGNWYTDKRRRLSTPRQVAAKPFVRPAMAKFDVAIEAAKTELLKRLDETLK